MNEKQLELTLQFLNTDMYLKSEYNHICAINDYETQQAKIDYIQSVFDTYIKPLLR